MVTPAQRVNTRRQDGLPTRTLHLEIDGQSVDVAMTRAEERVFRRRLRPFLDVARHLAVAEAARSETAVRTPTLSQQLREARVTALLGLPSVPAPGSSGSATLDLLVERTAGLYAKSLADETRATYRRRFATFSSWCDKHALSALPADPTTLMLFLADMVDREPQPSLSTLRSFVNAINRVHIELDMNSPSDDGAVRKLMHGLSHVATSSQPQQISALRVEDLRAVCRHLEHPDAVVVRDAAVVRLVLAGVPVAVIARLRWQDVRFDRAKVVLGERPAKNAAVTSWREVQAHPDPSRCPVAALQRWRSVAGSRPAVVFTLTDRTGRRDNRTFGPSGIKEIVAKRIDSLGPQSPSRRGHADLADIADLLHETATDVLRDRALLLLGFAMAARRGELTRLRWNDLSFVDEGLVVRIRRSKTDLQGRGTTVGVPWGRSALTCPVRALQAWRDRYVQQLGDDFTEDQHVLVKIGRTGRITADQPLTNEGLTMVVKRRMEAAGVTGKWGGRSLRAGLISSCADLDLPLELIALQSRHASLDSLVRYVRSEDVFRRNAVDRLGL